LSGDEEQLVQAYLNIGRNAAQAVVGGGIITLRTRVRRQFTLRAHRHRQVLETTVEDTGPGIEPALSARIFFPMVSSRADGTGLGLTIAHEIIDRHGGAIDCDSAAGCTRFNIYLPMAEQ
jgi:two-component system nitrogen regulation sensor histidine kinase GlnL